MCHATNYFPRLKLLTYFHCDIVHMINALISWHDSIPPPLSPPLPSCPCYRCTASLGNASRRSPIAVSLCQRTANARQSPCYSFNLHFSNATLIDIGQRTVDNGQRTTANGLQTGPDWIVRRFKYAACLPCASRVRNQKPAWHVAKVSLFFSVPFPLLSRPQPPSLPSLFPPIDLYSVRQLLNLNLPGDA